MIIAAALVNSVLLFRLHFYTIGTQHAQTSQCGRRIMWTDLHTKLIIR